MTLERQELARLSWPASRLAEGMVALAQRSALNLQAMEALPPRPGLSPEALGRWLGRVASRLDLEIEAVSTTYDQLEELLRHSGPSILRLPQENDERYLLLLAGDNRHVTLLAPELRVCRLPLETVRAGLVTDLEQRLAPEVAQILAAADIPARRRERARRAILGQRLSSRPIEIGWLLRLSPGAEPERQVRHAGVFRHLFTFVGAYAVQHLLFLLSWWVIGRAVLQGRLESGWLWAWALILLTIVPFRLLFTRAQGLLALHVGALLKRRLFYGVLRLVPDEIRHQGIGQLLGRVIESEAVESLALSGGFLGVVALVELLFAILVLALGAGNVVHVFSLLAWLTLGGLLTYRYYRERAHWTEMRLAMTHDLVEQMVGHRTRLAQEAPSQRHQAEDRALARYLALSQTMDGTATRLAAVLPRGWLLLGLLGLAPAFVAGAGTTALAVGLGGVLLALRSLDKLARSVTDLAGAAIAWRQIAQLYQAAGRPVAAGEPEAAIDTASPATAPFVQGQSLVFRYPGHAAPALRHCTFRLEQKARVLLQGPSGAGKSTLAALLAALRQPTDGSLRLWGSDQQSVGTETWRRQIVTVPQFHENHVLTATLAFNLLMGRRWPAAPETLQEVELLCQELGLGSLLATMPAGLLQMVGESGWQLSHGERSRLYLARALLQNAGLVILDESFAALDPENLRHALVVARQRTSGLLVIAHP